MAQRGLISWLIYILCVFALFQKGPAALIETQHTVMAAVGEESCLKCQLMQSKDVLQVTWQKILPEGEKNVASYSRYLGPRVNSGFQGKVEVKAAGLQNSSIVFKNVTDQNEGCYRCLFNCLPEGAFIGRTCLKIYELHGPFLHHDSADVSCSATGHPAPTVTLTVPHYNYTSVANSNNTVSVTVTARLHENSTKVGCAARVLSAPLKEAFVMIPEVKRSSADDVDFNTVLSVILASVCVAAAAVIILVVLILRKHRICLSQRDSAMTKTPLKTTKDSHEAQTPLMTNENELRQRMSSVKRNHHREASSRENVTKKLFP